MEVQSVSRWDATPVETRSKRKTKLFRYFSIVFTLAVVGILGGYSIRPYFDSIIFGENSERLYPRLTREALADGASRDDLADIVADLELSTRALKADNQRIDAELSQLIGHNGVIDRLVAHIRALHAQDEATRRDVVGVMTGPVPSTGLEVDIEGFEPGSAVEEAETRFFSRAKHTIVSPAGGARLAEETEAPRDQRGSPAEVEPEEGATN